MFVGSLFDRGTAVHCRATVVATWDGRALVGPAIHGTIANDRGEQHVWVRDSFGDLHAVDRKDVEVQP
jgi:hypothetical protein